MADIRKTLSRIQLVRVPSRKLTIIMVATAIVLSMGALAILHFSTKELKARTDDLARRAALLESEQEDLQQDIAQVDSIQGIVDIAEEELGLVEPDAVFYQPEP